MSEIASALIGIALVLSAVFLPMAFFGGATGVIYRQFSITIVSAMALSVLVALTLTPALCATFLKPNHKPPSEHGFFGGFNRRYDRMQTRYESLVGHVIHRSLRYLLIYAVLIGVMCVLFIRLPTGFYRPKIRVMSWCNIPCQQGQPVGAPWRSVRR